MTNRVHELKNITGRQGRSGHVASSRSTVLSRKFIGKTFWVLMDQGLYGISNLIISVLLARWFVASMYGAYTIALSVFFIVMALYNALIVEPMMVFGPKRYRHRFSEYLGVLFLGHVIYSAISAVLMLVVGTYFYFFDANGSASSFLGLVIATPFMLFVWFLRQATYTCHQPKLAAFASLAYMVMMLASSWILYHFDWLTPFTAIGAMGLAGFLPGCWLAVRLRLDWMAMFRSTMVRPVLIRHWRYGKWSAATRLPMRLPGSVIPLVLSMWVGLAAVGALKAIINFITPMMHVHSALSGILVPTLAREDQGSPAFLRLTRSMFFLFVFGAAFFWVVLGLFGRPLIGWAYDGRYVEYASLLWIIGFQPVMAGATIVLGAALRASEQPDRVFWAYSLGAAVAAPFCLMLIAGYGLTGAALGLPLLNLITAVLLWYYVRKLKPAFPATVSTTVSVSVE